MMRSFLSRSISLVVFTGLYFSTIPVYAGTDTTMRAGKGTFIFNQYKPLADKPLNIWYYRPEQIKKNTPIMILMHGNSRAAENYRNAMAVEAQRYGFILVVPEFSKSLFPSSRDYHQGGVFGRSGIRNDPKRRAFAIIEPLFDYVKQITGNTSQGYLFYGFSAGSQFVHRYMMFVPDNRAIKTISASAGTYTMPERNVEYAYGLKGTRITTADLHKFFAKDFTVAVGSADTVLSRRDLVKSPGANRQGRDRVERAETFYNMAKSMAERAGVPFNWKLQFIADAGHSQADVAAPVASLFFEPASIGRRSQKSLSVRKQLLKK